MTKKDLIEKMKDLPDNAPVILLDYTTDDPYTMTYSTDLENMVDDYFADAEDQEKPKGKAFFIGFENRLNPNPI